MGPQNGNTVFLTEQEAERIRSTVKERVKKCKAAAGQPREPRDAKSAISDATGASLMADMADMGSNQSATIPAMGVGLPYPPCVLPLEDLQPMNLTDLKLETHHRGYRLTVKRASPVVTLAARSWTMVQDEAGKETERLEMCLHKKRHGKEVLESPASLFVIKEPYFTLNDDGEPTLRIDHPSDLVVLPKTPSKVDGEADAAAAEKKARSCKDAGNKALEKQDLLLAYAKYTEGLTIARQDIVSSTNPDLARDLARNRAHVNLLLNQLDEAKADAKASLINSPDDQRSKELDSKALFRAGTAAYTLGDYAEAKQLFEQRLQLTPDISAKETTAMLRRIETRLREQSSGTYDFAKLRATLSRARPRVDAASFLANTTVKASAGRGRGLFAARAIKQGEIVLAERAFCAVFGFEADALTAMTYDVRDDRIRAAPVGLWRALAQKLLSNPSRLAEVLELYGDWQGVDTNTTTTTTLPYPELPPVDVFRLADITSRNAFGPGSQFGEASSTGLWVRASYTNHSCVPNCAKEYVGDLLVLRALRPLAAGEEIFHAYDESADYEARQEALRTTWGFGCGCRLCEVEGKEEKGVREKRGKLVREAEEFLGREGWEGANRRTVARAQRIRKGIEETYRGKEFEGLPWLGVKGIKEWLARAEGKKADAGTGSRR